jgi:glucokinase
MAEHAHAPAVRRLAVGVEIADAATRLTALLDTRPGAPRWHIRLPAPPTPDDTVAHIAELVQRARGEGAAACFLAASTVAPDPAPVSVGVAIWGDLDAQRATVRALPPASAWSGYPLAARLSAALNAPVTLDSAANAAALAEAQLGAARGYHSALYLLLGRCIRSALYADGRILRGEHGSAGMLGHWQVRADGPRCSCGARGHLDPLASAQSIVRAMIGRASGSDESTAAMLRVTGGRAEAMSAAQVVRLAAEGEPAAHAVVADALDALAVALANAVALLDPGIVVLDGPLVEAGDAFFAPLRAELEARCAGFTTAPPLMPSSLFPHTTLVGARLLASVEPPRGSGADGETR